MEDELRRKRFLGGVELAWTTRVPMMMGLGDMFSGLSSSKPTGLPAAAGGWAES
jgi:hypothetical protein